MTIKPTLMNYLKAGWASLVIPVSPPNARVAPNSSLKKGQLGKTPAKFDPDTKLWRGYAWTLEGPMTEQVAELHDKAGASIGFRMGVNTYYAIDLDITDWEVLDYLLTWLKEQGIPLVHIRTVDHPDHIKCLILIRVTSSPEPLHKRTFRFTQPNGQEGAIEFLGMGQQFVGHGQHATRLSPYVWDTAPLDKEVGSITLEALDKVWSEIPPALEDFGCNKVVSKAGPSSGAKTKGGETGSIEEVTALLEMIPNDERFRDRGTWVGMLFALVQALGRTPEAMTLWLNWCDKTEQGNPDEPMKVWDSEQSSQTDNVRSSGIVRLREWASKTNPTSYNAFTAVRAAAAFDDEYADYTEKPEERVKSPLFESYKSLEELTKVYAYARGPHQFVDTTNGVQCGVDAFNLAFNRVYIAELAVPGTSKKQRLSDMFTQRYPERCAAAFTEWPGKPAICKVDGTWCVNLYVPPLRPWKGKPIDPEIIEIYRRHCAYVLGSYKLADIWIAWHALLLQNNVKRPNWSWLIMTIQGIGKDMMVEPVTHAHGRHAHSITIDMLKSDFNDFLLARLLLISEFHGNAPRAYAKIKESLQAGPKIMINRKNLKAYAASNRMAAVLFSNDTVPVSIEPDDRRLYVIDNREARKRSSKYYGDFRVFLDDNMDMIGEYLHTMPIPKAMLNILMAEPAMTLGKMDIIEAALSDTVAALHEIRDTLRDYDVDGDDLYRPFATAGDIYKWLKHAGLDIRTPPRAALLRSVGMEPVISDKRQRYSAGMVKGCGRLWRVTPVWRGNTLAEYSLQAVARLYKEGKTGPIAVDDEADEADAPDEEV